MNPLPRCAGALEKAERFFLLLRFGMTGFAAALSIYSAGTGIADGSARRRSRSIKR